MDRRRDRRVRGREGARRPDVPVPRPLPPDVLVKKVHADAAEHRRDDAADDGADDEALRELPGAAAVLVVVADDDGVRDEAVAGPLVGVVRALREAVHEGRQPRVGLRRRHRDGEGAVLVGRLEAVARLLAGVAVHGAVEPHLLGEVEAENVPRRRVGAVRALERVAGDGPDFHGHVLDAVGARHLGVDVDECAHHSALVGRGVRAVREAEVLAQEVEVRREAA
mmetsp:Transcript_11632/g.35334  ORF Transcript_11632/g.35334 Transcript_11632/m.35334 type:complete len:224 (-) Transcript_11632:763-1434(-)